MLEDKISAGSKLSASERRHLKRAYQDGDSNRSGRFRIVFLALLAVIGVMLFTQATLAVGGNAGDKVAAEIFDRPV